MNQKQFDSLAKLTSKETGAEFIQVKFLHIVYLKGDATSAIVLAYILNELRMKVRNTRDRKRLVKNEGWFSCPAREIQNDLHVSKDKQIRAMSVLKEKNLIDYKHGRGNGLIVRVVPEGFAKMNGQKSGIPKSEIRSRETRNQKSGNPKSEVGKPEILCDLHKHTNNRERRHPSGDRHTPSKLTKQSKQYSEECRTGAKHLRDSLRKSKKQVSNLGNAAKWEEPLRLLEEVDKQDNWMSYLRRYCKALPRLKELEQEGYKLPLCSNAEQFRKHYNWICDVLDRLGEEDIQDRNTSKSRFNIYAQDGEDQ